MKLAFILFGIMLLGIVFEVVEAYEAIWFPPEGIGNYFFIVKFQLHFSSFVYYCIETITVVALGLIIWFRPPSNHFIKAFVLLEFVDMIDFVLTGNSMWFRYCGAPITYNVAKCSIFGSLIAYEFIRNVFTKQLFT